MEFKDKRLPMDFFASKNIVADPKVVVNLIDHIIRAEKAGQEAVAQNLKDQLKDMLRAGDTGNANYNNTLGDLIDNIHRAEKAGHEAVAQNLKDQLKDMLRQAHVQPRAAAISESAKPTPLKPPHK